MPVHDIKHPALRAIADLSKNGIVRVCWSNGDKAVVRYDIFIPSDETVDGSEEWVADVIEVLDLHPSSPRGLSNGAPTTISSADPPSSVSSPDGTTSWP